MWSWDFRAAAPRTWRRGGERGNGGTDWNSQRSRTSTRLGPPHRPLLAVHPFSAPPPIHCGLPGTCRALPPHAPHPHSMQRKSPFPWAHGH